MSTNSHNQKSAAAPHLALIAVQISFATWPIVGKLALRTLPPVALVGIRVAGATLILVVLARASGTLSMIELEDFPVLILSSVLGVIFNQWLSVKGLSLTTAVNSALLATLIPVSALVVGIVLRTDRATWQRVLGIMVAGAGVLYLIGPNRSAFSAATRAGDLLIVANSLCYGAYLAVSKNLVRKYSSLTVITWIFMIACVATIPPALFGLRQVQLGAVPWQVWLEVAYLITIVTAIAYYLNAWALARVPPSTVAVYIYLQPLIAFILAPLVLGEKPGTRALISSVLIFAGVLIVTRKRRRRTTGEAQLLEEVEP